MKIQKLSDDEYVEKIRNQDHTRRRLWWLWPVLFVGMSYGLIVFSYIIEKFAANFTGEKKLLYSCLCLGVIYGVGLCVTAAQTALIIRKWIEARHGFRTERLMLKYHDEFKNETSNKAMHQRPALGK